ncbi:MAG: hypothetical protein II918_09290 [Firmicutes bacterium]|nr:hypothetical protein [Bacillota bacterium]
MVGTTYEIWNNEPGNMDVVTNYTLAHVFENIYEELSGMEDPDLLQAIREEFEEAKKDF